MTGQVRPCAVYIVLCYRLQVMSREGMYVEGCHATVFILETSSLKSCPGWSRGCLLTYLERCRKSRCGLANSYLAVVTDPTNPHLSTHEIQVGAWSPIRQLIFRTPRPARRRWGRDRGQRSRPVPQPPPLVDVHYTYSLLRKMVVALDSAAATEPEQATPPHGRLWGVVATQLHTLLDNPPWSPEGTYITDLTPA